jgi:hypothetical protein
MIDDGWCSSEGIQVPDEKQIAGENEGSMDKAFQICTRMCWLRLSRLLKAFLHPL